MPNGIYIYQWLWSGPGHAGMTLAWISLEVALTNQGWGNTGAPNQSRLTVSGDLSKSGENRCQLICEIGKSQRVIIKPSTYYYNWRNGSVSAISCPCLNRSRPHPERVSIEDLTKTHICRPHTQIEWAVVHSAKLPSDAGGCHVQNYREITDTLFRYGSSSQTGFCP